MSKIHKFFRKQGPVSVILSVVLSVLFVVVAVEAATTIGTNVNTGGTLTVTGATTVTGAAIIYGATSIGGALTATSTLAVSGVTTFAGNASTTGSAILKSATINSDTGAISFGDENLSTSGTLTLSSGALSFATASSTGLASLNSIKVSSVGDTVSDIQFGTCTVNFGTSLGAGVATTTNCAATGVTTSHKVFMTPSNLETYVAFNSASSTANDVIQVQVFNTSTSTPATIASHTWSWMAIK